MLKRRKSCTTIDALAARYQAANKKDKIACSMRFLGLFINEMDTLSTSKAFVVGREEVAALLLGTRKAMLSEQSSRLKQSRSFGWRALDAAAKHNPIWPA